MLSTRWVCGVASSSVLVCAPISPVAAQLLLVADAAGNRVVLLDPFTGSNVATVATGPGPHEIAVSRLAWVLLRNF
jgi:hypothetical protein